MVMKRRNVYNFIATNKLRRALKRNKTNDGVGFIVRLFGGIGMLILFDFLSDLRVELLYPFYLFVSEFNDIFRFKGFLYLLCYMFLALSVDMLCYYFMTIQWLLFTSSSIVWFQFTWDSDRGYSSSSFLPVWLTLCGFEFFIRGRHIKSGYSIPQEISRPFAAHGVGHPIFMLCFFCKNFIFYRIKVFRRRGIRRENEALMSLMRDALTNDNIDSNSSSNISNNMFVDVSDSRNTTDENLIHSNGHSISNDTTSKPNSSIALSSHKCSENGAILSNSTIANNKHPNGHSLFLTKLISNQLQPSNTISNSSFSTTSTTTSLFSFPPSSTSSSSHSSSNSSSYSSSSLNYPPGSLVNSGRRLSNRPTVNETLLFSKILVLIKKPLTYIDSQHITKSLRLLSLNIMRITGILLLAERLHYCVTLVLTLLRFFSSDSTTKTLLTNDSNNSTTSISANSVSPSIVTCSSIVRSNNCPTSDSINCSSSLDDTTHTSCSSLQQCNGNSVSSGQSSIDSVQKRKNSLESSNSKQKSNKQNSKLKNSNGNLQALLNNHNGLSNGGSIGENDLLQKWETILKSKDDQITNLKYQNNKLKCDVEITQQARDDVISQLKNIEKSEKNIEKRLKNAQNEVQTLQKKVHTMTQTKQQDKQTIQKLEKSLEDERKRHKATAEQQLQAEARAASALESVNKANSFAETWRNKCRDSCNQQKRQFEIDNYALKQELNRRKEKENQQEQIIKELNEHGNRLNLLSNVYQEKCMTLEKQLSCANSEKYDLKRILAERENEIAELRSKLSRYTSNINSKAFNSSPITGNGFPCSTDFEQQIVNNRELVNRCFSSCSPGSSSQAQPSLSPSVFSSPTPPTSMLGPLSTQNISPGSGGSNKLNATAGFHHHLNSPDSDGLIRNAFRLSRDSQIWPQSSSTPTGSASISNTVTGASNSTIIRSCDSSNLGAVGSERESANGRHSSQSNCSINNRLNGTAPGLTLTNGFSTSGTILAPSTSSSSSPLGSTSATKNNLPNIGNLPGQARNVNCSKVYDDFFLEDTVFGIQTMSNNSQSFF